MKKILSSLITLVLLATMTIFVSCKEEKSDPPLLSDFTYSLTSTLDLSISAIDKGTITSIDLLYRTQNESSFTRLGMTADPDKANYYTVSVPTQNPNDTVFMYVQAKNNSNLVSVYPSGAPNTLAIYIFGGIDYSNLVINEIWAGAGTDNEKFIELFNKSTTDTIDMSGIYFKRNITEDVGTIAAGIKLAPGAYYSLGTKNNAVGYDGSISSGFSAKKSIFFEMYSPTGDLIDSFLRGSMSNLDATISDLAPKSFARIPNGTGTWKSVDNPTLKAANDGTGAADISNE